MAEERTSKEKRERSPGAYIGAIIGNLIAFVIVNTLPRWGLQFITADYPAILWAANLSLVTQIVGNAILIFAHPRVLHYAAQTVFGVVSLLSIIVILSVFPFDFTNRGGVPVHTIVRVVLWVGLAGTGIAIVTNALKTVGSLFGRRQDED